jgi:hypothetical protein
LRLDQCDELEQIAQQEPDGALRGALHDHVEATRQLRLREQGR